MVKNIYSYIFIFTLILIVIISIGVVRYETNKLKIDDWTPYTVKNGDTIWEIVPSDSRYDAWKIINEVLKYNEIDYNIHPGDIIYLPIINK